MKERKYPSDLQLNCDFCNSLFFIRKNEHDRQKRDGQKHFYCSRKCSVKVSSKIIDRKQDVNCLQCHLSFKKKLSQIKKWPSHFCSMRCAGLFNNARKKYGTRRSKLEKWLEEQLVILYPNLVIKYNDILTLQLELDIYIPSLQLAIELNGIVHYKPIYGLNKLSSTQSKDKKKLQACVDRDIHLLVIDVSSMKKFNQQNSFPYLFLIQNAINKLL